MQTSHATETKTKPHVESKSKPAGPQTAYDWLRVIRSHLGEGDKKPEQPTSAPSSPLSDFVVVEPAKPTHFTNLAQVVAAHMAERAGRYGPNGCGGMQHLINLTGKAGPGQVVPGIDEKLHQRIADGTDQSLVVLRHADLPCGDRKGLLAAAEQWKSFMALPDGDSQRMYDEAFGRLFPAMKTIVPQLGRLGLCVAGGAAALALSSCLCQRSGDTKDASGAKGVWPGQFGDQAPGDLDLFFIRKMNDQELWSVVTEVGNLLQAYAWTTNTAKMTVHVDERCATFTSPGMVTVQIVRRQFGNCAQVINDFDHPPCCVAYNGRDCWLSKLGCVAHAYLLNVVDMEGRRASYEHRLVRYFNRGFGLALVGVDPVAFSKACSRFLVAGAVTLGCGRLQWFPQAAGKMTTGWFNMAGLVKNESKSQLEPVPADPMSCKAHLAFEDPVLSSELNFLAASASPANTAGLCGRAGWKRGLNPSALSGYLGSFTQVLEQAMAKGTGLGRHRLEKLVGVQAARELMHHYVDHPDMDIGKLAEEMCRKVAANTALPRTFAHTTRALQNLHKTVTLQEWYGDLALRA